MELRITSFTEAREEEVFGSNICAALARKAIDFYRIGGGQICHAEILQLIWIRGLHHGRRRCSHDDKQC